jgi:DNA-binding response OmpR family regulator
MAKVLVLEDDFWIADVVLDWLGLAGHEVIGPFFENANAIKAIVDLKPDMAVLDVNVGGGVSGKPTAELLASLGTPYIVLTGYNRMDVSDFGKASAWLIKPVLERELLEAVQKCLSPHPGQSLNRADSGDSSFSANSIPGLTDTVRPDVSK